MSRTTGGLLAALALLAMTSAAAAQEPDEPGEEPIPNAGAEVGGVAEIDVGQQIFGGQAADVIRKRLDDALDQNLKFYSSKYGLTPLQIRKLRAAGRRDIKRYFDRVEELKSRVRHVRGAGNQVGNEVFELQRIARWHHSDVFGAESMLAKTFKSTLTLEQAARHDKDDYRKRVEWLAGLLESRQVLTADQRRRFVDLVVAETLPLKRYGDYDYDAIMFQVSRLPSEKLRSVLDERQCRELSLRFEQARRMESVLVSGGYLWTPRTPPGSAASGVGSRHEEARR